MVKKMSDQSFASTGRFIVINRARIEKRIQGMKKWLLLIFVASIASACVVKPKYPIDFNQAAKLGFQKDYIVRLGDVVNAAYGVFDQQTKDRCFKPNPPFPEKFPIGFKPILNLQGVDNLKHPFKEFYGHVSWQLPAKKTLVISIRGTSDIQEWIDDAKYTLVPYSPDSADGKVEQGFSEIFRSMTVSAPVQKKCSETEAAEVKFESLGNYLAGLSSVDEIVVVGHSLGSSIAALVAFQAKQLLSKAEVKLLTFASPLTGDAQFVGTYQSQIIDSVRVVNRPDIVPRVPPPFMGYRHTWHQLQIDSYPMHEVKRSVVCYHSLDTYLYVLRGAQGELAAGCSAASDLAK